MRPAFFRGGPSFSRPAGRKWPQEGSHTLGAQLLWEHERKALGVPMWQKSPVPRGLIGSELNPRQRAPPLPTPCVSLLWAGHHGQLRPAAQGPPGHWLRALGSGSGRAGPVQSPRGCNCSYITLGFRCMWGVAGGRKGDLQQGHRKVTSSKGGTTKVPNVSREGWTAWGQGKEHRLGGFLHHSGKLWSYPFGQGAPKCRAGNVDVPSSGAG